VPSALIDVLHVALAKEPGARYASTRDMLTAVEAIPFSEADRRESERLLRALAAGSLVEKIAIRGLPALPTGPPMATNLPAPPPPARPGARLPNVRHQHRGAARRDAPTRAHRLAQP